MTRRLARHLAITLLGLALLIVGAWLATITAIRRRMTNAYR